MTTLATFGTSQPAEEVTEYAVGNLVSVPEHPDVSAFGYDTPAGLVLWIVNKAGYSQSIDINFPKCFDLGRASLHAVDAASEAEFDPNVLDARGTDYRGRRFEISRYAIANIVVPQREKLDA